MFNKFQRTEMKFLQQDEKQYFSMTDMTFTEVKTIRDALKTHSKNGSAQAAKIVLDIEKMLDNMAV